MPASADVNGHLDRNYANLRSTFIDWCRLDDDADRTEVMLAYLAQLNLGDSNRIGGSSVATSRRRAGSEAPTVLVIGSHDVRDLSPVEGPSTPANGEELRGAGTGRLLGSFMAFVEGFKATVMGPGDEPVNLHAMSIGPGDDPRALIEREVEDPIDVVVMTDAVNWSPEMPTVTIGSRGRLRATITMHASRAVHDGAFGGASLNPLNRLIDVVASLRNDRGRIALDGFYDRAQRPNRDALQALSGSNWLDAIGASAPGGSLSPIDRATQWPVISVLDVAADAVDGSSPRQATAELAIHLVPDQRPVDVERALRSWLQERTPPSLSSTLRIDESARPYRVEAESAALAAQTRAIKKTFGRQPLPVPAGGFIGAGEIHYATAAPVLFAGISGPHQRWGSVAEALTPELLDRGVRVAAELCLQLPRRSSVRSA